MFKYNSVNDVTRRKSIVFGLGSVSAGMLAGCGGGSADSAFESKQAELLQSETSSDVPGPVFEVLNFATGAREVYFMEIAHRGALKHEVYYCLGSNSTLISSREAQLAAHHSALNFATLDTTPLDRPNTNVSRTNLRNNSYLKVIVFDSSGPITITAGGPFSPSEMAFRDSYFYDGYDETEWLFAGSRDKSKWQVAVRFFKAAPEDMDDRRSTFISNIVLNEPEHDHSYQKSISFSTNTGPYENTSARLGSITDGSGVDTLVVSHRYSGHYELIRPIAQAHSSPAAKTYAQRRLARHLNAYMQTVSDGRVIDSSNISAYTIPIHQQALYALGGHSLWTFAQGNLSLLLDKFRNSDERMEFGSNIDQLLEKVEALDSDSDFTDIRILRNNAENYLVTDSHLYFGATASSVLHIKGTGSFKIPDLPISGNYGLKLSFQLGKASRSFISARNGLPDRWENTFYRVSQRATEGTRISITPVLDASWTPEEGEPSPGEALPFNVLTALSVAVEFPIALTIKKIVEDGVEKRVARVDGIAMEINVDIPTNTWLKRLISKALVKLSSSFPPGAVNTIISAPGELLTKCVSTPAMQKLNAIVNRMNFVGGNLIPDSVLTKLKNGISTAVNATTLKNWSLIEVSILKLTVLNSATTDLAQGSEFKPGWQGNALVSFTPSMKYLEGVGYQVKIGDANFVCRVMGVFDGYFLWSNANTQTGAPRSLVFGDGN